MKKRNIALCVIFSIITFGIYGIYWFIKINNDANELANPPKRTSGGVAFPAHAHYMRHLRHLLGLQNGKTVGFCA